MSRNEREKETRERAATYLSLGGRGAKVKNFLGDGTDGWVWQSTDDTAVKAYLAPRGYWNERDSYERLAEYGFTNKIGEFWVPMMQGFDDDLLVVEMDVVQKPPYIIDFAKIKLNFPPEFSDDVVATLDEQGEERFEHNWPKVKNLLRDLESIGIYYLDPQRGNITFPDMP
jgi:hypothetical protein